MRTVHVDLEDRSYPIHIGPGARGMIQKCIVGLGPSAKIAVVADRDVADMHLPALLEQIAPEPLVLTFPSGETSKSLLTVRDLCEQLADACVERSAIIIAFGGGVAGDLAGFVAATWLRGVRFIQVPTTLLAAVDASVGGKTAVNLAAGKNLVGAFHQPSAVFIDTDFLRTLPPRDRAAGLAESVKHAAIRDPDFLAWHEAHVDALRGHAADVLSEMIARDCAIKAAVVSADEREADLRAILNHGHTIGHALEHLLGYELRHGECVALGMLVENELATKRGWLKAADAERIRQLLERHGLPLRLTRRTPADKVWAACQIDKKVRGHAVHFVLLRELGRPERVADVTPDDVAAALKVVQPL